MNVRKSLLNLASVHAWSDGFETQGIHRISHLNSICIQIFDVTSHGYNKFIPSNVTKKNVTS